MAITIQELIQQQEDELAQLVNRSERLRRKYDQFFLGLEKREPGFEREQLERDLNRSRLHRTPNTGIRFRFQQFLARHRTYAAYWNRVLREMEEGTYRRGAVTRAERLAAMQAEAGIRIAQGLDGGTGRPPEGVETETSADERRLSAAAAEAQRVLARMLGGAAEPSPASAASPTPPPPPPLRKGPGPRVADDIADLYARYVHAKQERGDDVSKITLRRFAQSVQRQRDAARERLGQDVDLKLKVTEQKVILVATKKRTS